MEHRDGKELLEPMEHRDGKDLLDNLLLVFRATRGGRV
jgi:hypothetical protein